MCFYFGGASPTCSCEWFLTCVSFNIVVSVMWGGAWAPRQGLSGVSCRCG